MKKYIIIYISALICIALIVFQLRTISELKEDNVRQFQNIARLANEADTFRTRNNELAAKVSSLQLTEKEYRKLYEDEAKEIKKLKSRNAELEHAIKTASTSEVIVKTAVKDSIVYRDKLDTVKTIEWENAPWEKVKAEIIGDSAWIDIEHYDEVDVNIFLEYKKFLWWKIKLKDVDVNVISHNPYTRSIDVSSISIY